LGILFCRDARLAQKPLLPALKFALKKRGPAFRSMAQKHLILGHWQVSGLPTIRPASGGLGDEPDILSGADVLLRREEHRWRFAGQFCVPAKIFTKENKVFLSCETEALRRGEEA
jgi:hypothetical protein